MEDMEVTIRQLEQQNLQLAKKNENLEAENRLLVKNKYFKELITFPPYRWRKGKRGGWGRIV
jgi:cell division protein FtsB